MHFIYPVIFLGLLLGYNKNKSDNSVSDADGYTLIWSDEFNKNGLVDTTKWRFENGFVRNKEDQWYQAENASCVNGNLLIVGKKEHKPNPNYIAGSNNWKTNRPFIEYTAASLVMKKEYAFKYGKVEVRAKIDAQNGLWPAIWTLGVSGEWPSNGEVDIMEYYNDKIHANFAIANAARYNAKWDAATKTITELGGQKWADQFHVWTLEWDENRMAISIDGILLNDIDVTKSFNKSDGNNPFRQPHYLLLNLAMGGMNGGSLENTVLPSNYLVDYVRVYQKK